MRINRSGSFCSLVGNKYSPLYGAFVCVIVFLAVLATLAFSGCAGLVSGPSNTSSPPAPSTLQITNVQATSATTSTSQIVWTTNVAADSAVDYGTSTMYGSSAPADSAMVTNHQLTVSGLAAGTTYYYQVRSTDSKGNHGQSGGHTFKTSGFGISGTINPATGGSGATLTLSGAASTTTTADSLGNYTFAGLTNGTYTVAPSHAGFTFTPSSQSTTVNGANVTGVNFTANAAAVAPTINTQPASQTVTAGQTATFTVVAAGTTPLSYQWQKNGVTITGAMAASYNTPATTTSDNGASFAVVVSNTAGSMTSSAATLTVNPLPVQITATPSIVSFGNVVTGTSNSQTIQLRNNGGSSATISQANVSGAGFSATGLTVPVTIAAGGNVTFNAVFTPSTAGSATGSVSLVSNAPSSPMVISLSGTGVAPIFLVSANPTSLSFGNVNVGSASSLSAALTNNGNSNVTISSVTVTGTGFSTSGVTPPLTLTAGQTATLNVVFAPTTWGSVSGSVAVLSDATNSPATVTLSGSARSVDLSWTASTSVVVGYNVYRGTQPGGPYTKLNSAPVALTSYTDSTVQSAQTYFYVVTAIDSSNVESVYSNQASGIIP